MSKLLADPIVYAFVWLVVAGLVVGGIVGFFRMVGDIAKIRLHLDRLAPDVIADHKVAVRDRAKGGQP